MVTKLEIGSFIIEKTKTGGRYIISEERKIIAEKLPDVEDTYDTSLGKIGIKFEVDEYGHNIVRLDVSKVKALQGKGHREKRGVCISADGSGMTFLSHGRVLLVSTDAFKKKEVIKND